MLPPCVSKAAPVPQPDGVFKWPSPVDMSPEVRAAQLHSRPHGEHADLALGQ